MANGSATERMEFEVDLGVVLDNANRHGEAQRRHRMAIEGARELRRYEAMSIAHANLAISLSRNGKAEAAIEHALTSERLRAMSREATPRASTSPVLLMRLMRDAGRYADAMRWAELARAEIETHFPVLMAMSLAEESWLWIHLGQHRRAEACLLEARKFAMPYPWTRAAIHHRQGQIERSLGHDPRSHFEAAEACFSAEGLRIGRSAIALDLAAVLPPAEGLVAARRILEESVALEKGGLALAARVRTVQCLLDAGDPGRAAAQAREMLAGADGVPTDDVYRVEMWWQAQRAFDAAGFGDEAGAARRTAVQWIERVVHEELPPAMRHAFIEANPINRALLRAARV
jgi:tetratricopeptide (TPR) repeat protein